MDNDGVKCWGNNDYGQINVPLLLNPSDLIAGGRHTCAIDDLEIKCWGDNEDGQIDVPLINNPISINV